MAKKINKRKRKRKYFQMNNNTVNSPTIDPSATPTPEKHEDSGKLVQPTKKRKRNKKKKATEGGSAETSKPVLVVKNPEDYSANWKKLQEILTEDCKKMCSKDPVIREKINRNIKRRKSKKLQKMNGIESNSNKEDNENITTVENEKLDIWFDNVDPILLEESMHSQTTKNPAKPSIIPSSDKTSASKTLVKEESFDGVTKAVAMDCEMVGVGMNGKDSILARVSVVNQYGKELYDKFVQPTEEVVDYRTAVSGIRPADLVNGCDFNIVQKEVSDLIKGRILVGHAIHHDLQILFLSHPRSDIRDTSRYKGFVRQFGGRTPSLKKLVERFMGVQIQEGEHNSVQDAQAAMRLYTMHRKDWEKSRPNKYKKRYLEKKNMALANKKQELADPKSD